jgi:hypothetical protein
MSVRQPTHPSLAMCGCAQKKVHGCTTFDVVEVVLQNADNADWGEEDGCRKKTDFQLRDRK